MARASANIVLFTYSIAIYVTSFNYDQAVYFLQHLYTLAQTLIADQLMSQLGLARINNMPTSTQHNCDYFQTENSS